MAGTTSVGVRVAVLVVGLLLAFAGIAATDVERADAAIALRGTPVTTKDSSGGVTAKTFATPAAALSGDLLVATLAYRTPTTADILNTAPTGWTKIPGETFDPGATTAGIHLVVAVKRAIGGAEAPVWRFASAPRGLVVTVHAYSGASTKVDVANGVYPFEKWGYAPHSGSGTSTHKAPAFTPTVSGSWGFADFAGRWSEQWTPGPGLVERTDAAAASSSQASLETNDSKATIPVGSAITYSATEPSATSTEASFGGNIKPSSTSFPTSDSVAPETTIDSGPASTTASTTASFSFSGNDNVGVTGFDCRLDSGGWSACASPKAYSSLAVGSHTFHVRARDAAGNADQTPASAVWTIASAATTSAPSPHGPSGSWTMTFDDEFNGTSLDPAKWSPCWFYPTCGSQNNVKTDPANVSVANGSLILTLASSSSGASVSTNPNGGASPGFQFQYGVIEARMWFPGDGSNCYNWPAWWTAGQSWPSDGENDIAEVLGGDMTVNYHSNSGAHNQGAVPGYWCGAFHTYTLDRRAGHADVYYDGTLVKSYATDDGGALQYMLLNVGASSSRAAYGAASQVKVDYVRAWRPV